MALPPGNNNDLTIAPDNNLGVKLVLFDALLENSKLLTLKGKLLLTSEDESGSDYVFGYILNSPLPMRLRSFLKQSGLSEIPEAQQFKQIFDGAADGFEAVYEEECIAFLTRNGNRLGTTNEFTFGEFAAYTCETPEEAAEMLKLLEHRETIAINSLCMIERDQLIEAINKNQAHIRDADPDIVFNKSGYMRTVLAFPPKPATP
jgi:hypothetical protein